MKDGMMLSNYDVEDGHTVHLVAKPPRAAIAPTLTSTSSTEQDDDIPPRMRYGDANANSPNVNAIERGRTRLRNLMNSIDELERNVEARSMAPPGIREPNLRRPVMTSRRRIPGLDSSTETLSNIDRLRSALEARRNIAEINDRTTRMQSRFLREADRMAEDQRRGRRWPFGDQSEQSAHTMASDMGLSSNETTTPMNLDHIMQGMMTLRTVLSTVAVPSAPSDTEQSIDDEDEVLGYVQSETTPSREPESPGGRRVVRGRRRFFVGQWLDVRDTVNQWLESTVVDMSEDKVLVHYHGWPSRWDEWIDFDSDRIAAFRTRTTHTLNVQHMSPVPSTRLSNPPSAGSNNSVRHLVAEVRDMMHAILPHIERFAELCEQDEDQGMASAEEELDARARHSEELSETAHLVSPLFDRFGRILADSARCLDSLMRPELQQNSQQRRQLRASINRGSGYQTPEQRLAAASSSMRSHLIDEDTSIAVRDLVSTGVPVPAETNQPRRSIDVHIHAIVSPSSLSSLASLARATTMDQSENNPNRFQTPRTPPVGSVFDDAFGLPSLRRPQGGNDDERAILNDVDDEHDAHEADQSRTPLLGSYRRQGNTRRRRQVESNLDAFLADDFFGPSYSASEDEDSDNSSDGASPANSRESTSAHYQPPSANNSANLGVIPEIAQAEARARANENQILRGESSSSSSESSSTSSTGYPTFLEVMRRTLSGVRNFGFSSNSNRQADESEQEFETVNVATPSVPSPSSSAESFLTDEGIDDEAPSIHSSPSSNASNHILEDLDDLD